MLRSVRAKLALGNGLLFILLVTVLSLYLYLSYSHLLLSGLDQSLREYAETLAQNVAEDDADADEGAGPARSLGPPSGLDRDETELSTLAEFTVGEKVAQLIDRSGEMLDASTDVNQASPMVDKATVERAIRGDSYFLTREIVGQGKFRLYVRSAWWKEDGPTAALVVGEPMARIENAVGKLGWQLLAGAPLMVLLAIAVGYLVAYQNLRPVGRMIEGVRNIDGRGLDRRLVVENPEDELGRLASTFNDFLDRLQRAVESEQRFVADASHELRTPLSIIRGEIEVSLTKRRSPAEYESALRIVHSEVLRLNRLVDALLLLARAQVGKQALPKSPVDFGRLVSKVCMKLKPSAQANSILLDCDCSDEFVVQGVEESLELMVYNLVENAIFYSREGGHVVVQTGVARSKGFLVVEDDGAGISEVDLPKIFDRFYRADASRSDSRGHVGLGLALVKLIVDMHGGSIDVESRLGVGTRFTVSLPLGAS